MKRRATTAARHRRGFADLMALLMLGCALLGCRAGTSFEEAPTPSAAAEATLRSSQEPSVVPVSPKAIPEPTPHLLVEVNQDSPKPRLGRIQSPIFELPDTAVVLVAKQPKRGFPSVRIRTSDSDEVRFLDQTQGEIEVELPPGAYFLEIDDSFLNEPWYVRAFVMPSGDR